MSSSSIIFTAHQGMPRRTPLALFGMLVSLTLSLLNVESEHWVDGVYALSLKSIFKKTGPSFKNLKDGLKLAVHIRANGNNGPNMYGVVPKFKDESESSLKRLQRDLIDGSALDRFFKDVDGADEHGAWIWDSMSRGADEQGADEQGARYAELFLFDQTMPEYKEILKILRREKGGLYLPIENKINLLVSLLIVNFTKNIDNHKDAHYLFNFNYKKELEARLKQLLEKMPEDSDTHSISNKVNRFFQNEKQVYKKPLNYKVVSISEEALNFHGPLSSLKYTEDTAVAESTLAVLNLDGSLVNVTS